MTRRRAVGRLAACLVGLACWGLTGSTLQAAPVMYHVLVNTAAVFGAPGSLLFQFNPGALPPPPGSETATAVVDNFSTAGGVLGAAVAGGGGAGALPGGITIMNSAIPSFVKQAFTYGTNFEFDVTLSGDALDPPPLSLFGSTFSLSLLDALDMPLLTTDPSGAVLKIEVNPDGSQTILVFPSFAPNGPPVAQIVPEPSTLVLFALGLAALAVYHGRKRSWRAWLRPAAMSRG